MASEIQMPGPMCLIENVKGQLRANHKALGILSAIKQPVVVVAIVGLYRTGKSYLMNKLAGKKTGFSLGSTVQSHTKGIWMWCVSHPQKPGHTLVLLDTEGLGDVEKGDNQNDCWIFALAVLLSSTFVYNSMGTINQQALDQLHYVTELSDRIRAKSSPGVRENSGEFVRFFPDFVWTLRDFSLELKVDGKSVTADEYLENSLKLISGNSQNEKNLNEARRCIRKFFPKKKCFVFERPTHGKHLNRLESLQDDDLDSDFLGQVKEFCSYIFTCSETKTLSGGFKVNGPRLQNLVETYVKSISSGNLPCVENAVTTLSMKENSAAVKKAVTIYDQQMSQKVQLPTETLQELLDLHRACEKEAIKIFTKNSFNDIDQLFQMKLETELEKKREEFCKKNVQASLNRCSALLQNVFSSLEKDMKQGVYSKPGGYRLLVQKIQELKKKYHEEPRKGIQAQEALEKFLQSKEAEIDGILRTDQALTAREKEKEVERMKAEAAQARENLLKEMQRKNEQQMREKERSHQEYVKQIRKTIEMEEALKRAEELRVMDHKYQEQLRLLKEGFKEESKKLQDEINNLQKRTHDCVIS